MLACSATQSNGAYPSNKIMGLLLDSLTLVIFWCPSDGIVRSENARLWTLDATRLGVDQSNWCMGE